MKSVLRGAIPALWLASLSMLSSACSTASPTVSAIAPVPETRQAPPVRESGFLSDYSRLRPSDQFDSVLVWRDPDLKGGFRKLLFRPVSVWRGSDRRLDDIPEEDLQYLADSFYRAMVQRLGQSFEMTDKPGPAVLEIQLALTLVQKEDEPIDFFSTQVPILDLPERTRPLADATRMFVRNCALEAEFAQTETLPVEAASSLKKTDVKPRRSKRVVKAAFFDTRRGSETPKGKVATWADVDAVFEKWAEALDAQLTALKEGTFKPKFTVPGPPPATR